MTAKNSKTRREKESAFGHWHYMTITAKFTYLSSPSFVHSVKQQFNY